MDNIKISENEYQVILYDSIGELDDYVAGLIKREPKVNDWDNGDEHYFMFYPSCFSPICAGDLKRISELCAKLNKTLGEDTNAN